MVKKSEKKQKDTRIQKQKNSITVWEYFNI